MEFILEATSDECDVKISSYAEVRLWLIDDTTMGRKKKLNGNCFWSAIYNE